MSEQYVALNQELAQLKAKEEQIKAQLEAERDSVRSGLIESIKAHIQSYGFQVEDIASAMLPKTKGKRTVKNGKPAKPATQYVDKATGNIYSKGKIPQWMRDGMLANQISPDDKGSVQEYKKLYMTVIEPEELQQAA